jgi:hypothetical protein
MAASVRDNPELVTIAEVSHDSCLMCEIPKGVPMGYLTCRPHDNPRDQHVYSELQEDIVRCSPLTSFNGTC